jgi:hypothetical protein
MSLVKLPRQFQNIQNWHCWIWESDKKESDVRWWEFAVRLTARNGSMWELWSKLLEMIRELWSNLLEMIPPSPSTIECDVLPRSGSWDLGPPRMVDILARALPLFGSATYGVQVNVYYIIDLWWQIDERSSTWPEHPRMTSTCRNSVK